VIKYAPDPQDEDEDDNGDTCKACDAVAADNYPLGPDLGPVCDTCADEGMDRLTDAIQEKE